MASAPVKLRSTAGGPGWMARGGRRGCRRRAGKEAGAGVGAGESTRKVARANAGHLLEPSAAASAGPGA